MPESPLPLLLFPYGLYVEAFYRKVGDTPAVKGGDKRSARKKELTDAAVEFARAVALQHREPISGTAYVSVREAVGRLAGMIVSEVHKDEGPGRYRVRHEAANPDAVRCDKFAVVQILPAHKNCDVLARAGAFLSAGIKVFGIIPAKLTRQGKRGNDNQRPTSELSKIWRLGRDFERWPDAEKLADLGCPTWIIDLFQQREMQLPGAVGTGDLPILGEIARELAYDRKITTTILNRARPHRARCPHCTDREIVDESNRKLALSAFTNGTEWSTHVGKESATPDWYGDVYNWAHEVKDIMDHFAAKRPPRSDSPWRADGPGLALLEQLGQPPGKTLAEMIRDVRKEEKKLPRPLEVAIGRYADAKVKFAASGVQINKVNEQLTRLGVKPTVEQAKRAIMGFYSAIDRKVVDAATCTIPDKGLDFDRAVAEEIQTHLKMPDAKWCQLHDDNQKILNKMAARRDPSTGFLVGPSAKPKTPRGGVDNPEVMAVWREELRQIAATCLRDCTDEERYAFGVIELGEPNPRKVPPDLLCEPAKRAMEKWRATFDEIVQTTLRTECSKDERYAYQVFIGTKKNSRRVPMATIAELGNRVVRKIQKRLAIPDSDSAGD